MPPVDQHNTSQWAFQPLNASVLRATLLGATSSTKRETRRMHNEEAMGLKQPRWSPITDMNGIAVVSHWSQPVMAGVILVVLIGLIMRFSIEARQLSNRLKGARGRTHQKLASLGKCNTPRFCGLCPSNSSPSLLQTHGVFYDCCRDYVRPGFPDDCLSFTSSPLSSRTRPSVTTITIDKTAVDQGNG